MTDTPLPMPGYPAEEPPLTVHVGAGAALATIAPLLRDLADGFRRAWPPAEDMLPKAHEGDLQTVHEHVLWNRAVVRCVVEFAGAVAGVPEFVDPGEFDMYARRVRLLVERWERDSAKLAQALFDTRPEPA